MNEAELVFTRILGCNRTSLYTRGKSRLDKKQASALCSVFKRRLKGEPLQYIFGKTEFMGLEFKVNPCVLIPRPETEILVETVLRYAHSLLPARPCRAQAVGCVIQSHLRILDMCTGSGCIAVSLSKALAGARIDASDISVEALRVARYNARRHQADVRFIRSDLFNSAFLRKASYDILVCNPPYVAQREFAGLEPEIAYEPPQALRGGRDGLDFFRALSLFSPAYLSKTGLLIAEMGYRQSGRIRKIFKDSGSFDIVEIIRDYARIERIIVARKKGFHG